MGDGHFVGVDTAPKAIKGIAWFEQFTGDDCKIASVSMLNLRKASQRHTCMVEMESARQAEVITKRINDADLNAMARVLRSSADVDAFRATAQNPDAIAAFNPNFGNKDAIASTLAPVESSRPPPRAAPPSVGLSRSRSRDRGSRQAPQRNGSGSRYDGRRSPPPRRRSSRSPPAAKRSPAQQWRRSSRSPSPRPRDRSYGKQAASRRDDSRQRGGGGYSNSRRSPERYRRDDSRSRGYRNR